MLPRPQGARPNLGALELALPAAQIPAAGEGARLLERPSVWR